MFGGIDNILHNIPHIQFECEEYSTKYCQSHIALLWIWIMLWCRTELYQTFTNHSLIETIIGIPRANRAPSHHVVVMVGGATVGNTY